MATSNINNKHKKLVVATAFKKKNLFKSMLSTLLHYWHIFEKLNFILSVRCNKENKLKVKLTLTKPKFNGKL